MKSLFIAALIAAAAPSSCMTDGHPELDEGYIGAPTIVCPSSGTFRIVSVSGTPDGVTFVDATGETGRWALPSSGSWSGQQITSVGAGGNSLYLNGFPITFEKIQPQVTGMNPEPFNGGVQQILATGGDNRLLFSGCHDGSPKQVTVTFYAETWH